MIEGINSDKEKKKVSPVIKKERKKERKNHQWQRKNKRKKERKINKERIINEMKW